MKKVESVLNGFLGWGKARSLNTFPQILFGLLSLILPKIFIIQRGGGRRKRLPSPCGNALQAFSSLKFDITLFKVRRKTYEIN
ncbi:hypothetical protein ACFLRT_02140 [Acidobacteriota bacterium]